MSMLDHALDALKRGFYIFPCKPRSKQPNGELVPHGVKEATNNEAIVRAWWQEVPDGNYGIALGPSNITVLDIDSGVADLNAAREWCRRQQLPPTFTVRTGRRTSFGLQLYFSGVVPNRPYDHEGVAGEVRSGGYYVVGPGGIHPDSGEPYTILADRAFAPIPEFISRLSREKLPRPQGDSTQRIEPSCRHYYFVERGRELHFAGLSGAGLQAALLWLYENRCVRDTNKDEKIRSGELVEVARWIEEHPAEYPLEPRDFVALRHAEKDDKTQFAWAGQLALFNGDCEEAFDHLVKRLKSVGCREDQIERIVVASPLYEEMKKLQPAWMKGEKQ